MIAKLFNPYARLGHAVALSISLAALAGCGGKVLDVDSDGGKSDSVASDTASDSLEPDTFTPPPVEDSSITVTDAASSMACTDCVANHCPAEADACRASPDCVAVIKCINDCGSDNTCANACISDESKPGVPLADNLLTCVQDKCATECMF